MNLRVSSDFASFGGADGKALGCPNSRASGIADDQASSFLDSRSSGVDWRSSKLPWIAPSDFARFEDLSCPKPFSPGRRLIEFSGCPERSTLQRCRLILVLGRPIASIVRRCRRCIFELPRICSTAGSMMNSRLSSNLASSGKPADESSIPIESRSFLPDPRCFPNFNLTTHYRQADRASPVQSQSCICLPGFEVPSNSLQGHQLN